MNIAFLQNQSIPGDPNFIYDKRIDFSSRFDEIDDYDIQNDKKQ